MRYGTFDVEQRTQAIGRDLFQRVREARAPFSFNHWLDDRFLHLATGDEAVKAQLFRLVDALPSLTTPDQVNEHLREYLAVVAGRFPVPIQTAIAHWPKDGALGHAIATFTRTNVERLAHHFVAASNLVQTEQLIHSLRDQQLAFTIDVLGEAVLSEAEAGHYQQIYLQLIDTLATKLASAPEVPLIDRDDRGPLPRINLSIKLSALDSQFDPIDPAGTSCRVRDRLRPILRAARAHRVFINFDMEQVAYKDVTLRIFQEILTEEEFRHWENAGIALQAYLHDTETDLNQLLDWVEQRGTPVTVRLVKGAYWDTETVTAAQNNWPSPVFTEKAATDAHYERLTTFLLEHQTQLHPAIASHNIRSIARALAEAERLEVPAKSFEFQQLYGMGDPIKAALVDLGQRVRVYTPFGELLPGMAYLVRRLLENTSNTSFLRHGFIEHDPEERLLMNPTLAIESPATSEPAGFQNEPIADFSHAETRAAMTNALENVCRQLGQTHPLVIAGHRIQTGTTIDSLNPSHRTEIIGHCACATIAHATAAIDAARQAFPAWRETPVTKRADIIQKVAVGLRQRRFELAAWEILECAKQWREADADVSEAIDFCEYYAAEMLRLNEPRRRDVPGETNAYFYEPRGVAVIIAPWNFPLAILTGMTAAAIVTGNTAIMKPSETSPVIAAKLMEIFEAVGVPPGVVNYLPGHGSEIGPTLVQHPDVALIAFTGSREVGLSINRAAAENPPGQDHLKRVIAELGGKNAIIIDDDADLDEAIKGVTASAFGYAGQKCSACSRVIVLASVYDAFLPRLIAATRSLHIGPANDPASFIGPVIDQKARDRITAFIARTQHDYEPVYIGDLGSLTDEGFYVAPHIFADVSPQSPIAQEEIFGPVLVVLKAADLTAALEIANGVSYALTGGFYSRSPAHIDRARLEFRVGNLYINRKITGALVDRQPFGGFKMSGIGSKAGGPDYLQQFLIPRTVTENTLRHGFAPREQEV